MDGLVVGGGIIIIFLILLLALVIGLYIAIATFLNKFNVLVEGRTTALAWIPVCNVYLLGKLAINKIVGWILVASFLLTSTITTEFDGVENTYSILPESVAPIFSIFHSFATIGIFIYAIIKYNNLKKFRFNQQFQQPYPQQFQQPYPQQLGQQFQQPYPQQPGQQFQQPYQQQPGQ